MGRGDKVEIVWMDAPAPHNLPASESYLRLLYSDREAATIMASFMDAPMTSFKAKDILRASELKLLDDSNPQVRKNHDKIDQEVPLSPILLVRQGDGAKVIVADGYHRLCAIYHLDQDALIPCKIVPARP